MAAISAFNTPLTNRWRASMFLLSNCGDTMTAWNAWPQPPDRSSTSTYCACSCAASLLFNESAVTVAPGSVDEGVVAAMADDDDNDALVAASECADRAGVTVFERRGWRIWTRDRKRPCEGCDLLNSDIRARPCVYIKAGGTATTALGERAGVDWLELLCGELTVKIS